MNLFDTTRRFRQSDEAETWALSNFSAWRANLSADEIDALHQYKQFEGVEINLYLRAGRFGTDENRFYEKMIEDIDSALRKGRIDGDQIAFRMANHPLFALSRDELVGKEIDDTGFLSASLDPHYKMLDGMRNKTQMEIYIPNGYNSGRLEYFQTESLADNESEILLPRNTLMKVHDFKMEERFGKFEVLLI